MPVTIEEYAHMRGVSAATIEWMCSPPKTRPLCETYVDELEEVLTTPRRYGMLMGCSPNGVRDRLARGVLGLNEDGRLGVHESDLRWGLRYYEMRVAAISDPSLLDRIEHAVEATIYYQTIERELIRLGHLRPGKLIEQQLVCVARSPEWWRRFRAADRERSSAALAGVRSAAGGGGMVRPD